MTSGRFCVLVNSSDRARDIFEIVFRDAEKIWARCDWPRFAGFTSAQPDLYGFRSVATRGPSDWRCEFADQLDALPPEIEYVLRLEDDALFFSPVDGHKLNAIADLMLSENRACIRLLPVSRGLVGRAIEFFRRRLDRSPLRPVSFDEPYYSSLVLAIWRRSYLRELLNRPGTVWDFEFIVTNERHYAVWEPALDQAVIVTKGRWRRDARRLLARQGLSLAGSKREIQSVRSWFRGLRENASFQIFGFLGFRIRRRLNLLPTIPKDLKRDQYNVAPPKE
jgi:hypothetical protein